MTTTTKLLLNIFFSLSAVSVRPLTPSYRVTSIEEKKEGKHWRDQQSSIHGNHSAKEYTYNQTPLLDIRINQERFYIILFPRG